MSTEILTFTPEFGLKEGIEYITLIFQADSGREKRRNKCSQGIRSLECSLNCQSDTAINTIWAFFRARKGKYDSFWVKFPTTYKSTAEAVGIGNNSDTIFNLDFFPIDITSFKVYLAGVLQTSGYTVTNDMTNEVAKVTFTVHPGSGVAITADYEYYIQVRFDEDVFSKELIKYKLYNTSIKLKEVLWNIYSAP